MYQSPKSAKRLYFDVIPKATDEYLQQLEAFNKARAASNAAPIDNPAWHVHRGAPPQKGSPLSFSLLLNLVSAADASTKDILWGFISRYMPGASPETEPMLDRLTADLQYHGKALTLRADRQERIAENIANVDTPNYKARDVDFASALAEATGRRPGAGAGPSAGAGPPGAAASPVGAAHPRWLPVAGPPVSAGGAGSPGAPATLSMAASDTRHLSASGQTWSTRPDARYRVPDQASMDGNTVELDRERAAFADNAVKYEATLRFINGNVRTILSAIRGSDA